MNIKNIITYTLTFLLACLSLQVLPMKRRGRAFARVARKKIFTNNRIYSTLSRTKFSRNKWKNIYSKTWRGGVEALKYGLAFGPTSYYGYKKAACYFNWNGFEDHMNSLPNASQTLTDHVRRELEQAGIKNYKTVPVKVSYSTPNAGATVTHNKRYIMFNGNIDTKLALKNFKKYIYNNIPALEEERIRLIKQAPEALDIANKIIDLQKSSKPDLHELNKLVIELDSIVREFSGKDAINNVPPHIQAVGQHEIEHINRNDAFRKIIAAFAIPIATALGARFIFRNIIKKPAIWWHHLFGKPMQGAVLAGTNIAAYRYYSKKIEQNADNKIGIYNKLDKAVRLLKSYEELLHFCIQKEQPMNLKKIIESTKNKKKVLYFIGQAHPTNEIRLAEVRKRRKKLEAQLEQEKQNNLPDKKDILT